MVDHRSLAAQLRHIARRCTSEPMNAIARDLRAIADKLYPPIEGGKVVRDFDTKRVGAKTRSRQSFQIFVGK